MAFKKVRKSTNVPNSPEELLNDLRTRTIPGMLSHQADVTRSYIEKSINSTDVALQLPTGSGKTLVGLLLGEWRRRKFEERILYLCPTNQLVHQVAHEAKTKYGMHVNAFTGSKKSYSELAKSEYENAETVAITSYSGLFNTAPYFTEPQIILLDDAHAAENYIASYWSVRVEHFKHLSLYTALTAILEPIIPFADYSKMQGNWKSSWDKSWVDKIPTVVFQELIPEIINVFDTHVEGSDLRFTWSLLRDHLPACHMYINSQEILIRPLIPPTNTHAPFANAKQRIYMSATLGEGGDLERLTGRMDIERLTIPVGWDKQGIGRRLFFFPSFKQDDLTSLNLALMKKAGRTLVLVPDDNSAKELRVEIKEKLEFKTFEARDIELSKAPFIETPQAVAVVANRYDGINFPGDECRLLIAQGLPRSTNLQERFIVDRLGAIILLNDRILTRVVQAIGRCTRSPNDYSTIVITGEELSLYLRKKDRRKFLHPELQSEIEFGIEQSKQATSNDFIENFDLFIAHGDEWNEAEEDIISNRSLMIQERLPGIDNLRQSVQHEVSYQYYLWNGDFTRALEQCRSVLASLTDSNLRGYRALWYYLAGSAAYLGYKNGVDSLSSAAKTYFIEASKSANGVVWLNKLSHSQQPPNSQETEDIRTFTVIERMESVLDSLGTLHDRRFAEREKIILDGILSEDSIQFERAHVELGRLLGYDAGNKETAGAPDPWWMVDDSFCFIFEDHSEAQESSSLNVTKARQAGSHPNWVKDNLGVKANAKIIPVLITPVKKADFDALPHLKNVCYWNLEDFRQWVKTALSVIRTLRSSFSGTGDLAWRSQAIEAYKSNKLTPQSLMEFLCQNPASQILRN
jgi:Type III restriction enzyme, res subunit/Helicase C-terminal domain